MSKITLVKSCPICNKISYLAVDANKYSDYMNKNDLIQNVFPELNPAQREFIKTGYCSDCQHLLFCSDYKIEEGEN